jgi:hypothetical protein
MVPVGGYGRNPRVVVVVVKIIIIIECSNFVLKLRNFVISFLPFS